MKIIIETGEWAGRYIGDKTDVLHLDEGSSAADAIAALGIPPEEAGMVAVGGKAVSKGYVLSEGDVLKIYPVIIGG